MKMIGRDQEKTDAKRRAALEKVFGKNDKQVRRGLVLRLHKKDKQVRRWLVLRLHPSCKHVRSPAPHTHTHNAYTSTLFIHSLPQHMTPPPPPHTRHPHQHTCNTLAGVKPLSPNTAHRYTTRTTRTTPGEQGGIHPGSYCDPYGGAGDQQQVRRGGGGQEESLRDLRRLVQVVETCQAGRF